MRSRILIVDDEKAIRESVSLVLSEEGYETEIASTGKDALKYFRIAQQRYKKLNYRNEFVDTMISDIENR